MAKIGINLKDGTIKNDEQIIIGIDLGTTNSLVAYTNDEAEAFVVRDVDGKHALVPSILHFSEDGSFIVGDAAKEYLKTKPERTIFSVKRLMGKSYNDMEFVKELIGYKIIDQESDALLKIAIDDKYFTPIELSAEILKDLKRRIEQELNKAVSKAVITVPAYFNDTQRQATRDAGKLAGLEVLRIVNEPTAAALAYGLGIEADEEKTVAIYDLGGGTFDISILSIEDQVFEVLATNGDTFLGGDDFDRAIVQYWLKKNDIAKSLIENDKIFGQEIRLLAEQAKKKLSNDDNFLGKIENQTFEISRTIFDDLIKGLIDRTIESCKIALKDSKMSVDDIDEIILVGGSTRVPAVKEAVKDFFGKKPNDNLDPDEVVALGAAVQASILSGKQKGMLLIDVTPLSLGIETVGGLMDVIISRNSKVPNALAREYTTSVDGQKNLKISVYQGERDLVEHNRKLGEFILKNIPPMPAGLPKIQVKFILDADGILKVKASELRSKTEQEITIKSQFGISEEEMAKMLIDSIQNAESDMKAKALLEAINEAENVIRASERFIIQNQTWLAKADTKMINELVDDLRVAVSAKNKDTINSEMEKLNTFTAPLAHRALDEAVKSSLGGTKL